MSRFKSPREYRRLSRARWRRHDLAEIWLTVAALLTDLADRAQARADRAAEREEVLRVGENAMFNHMRAVEPLPTEEGADWP